MNEYTLPIKTAILTFPIFAAVFTLPFLIYQYRKHGYINYYRAILIYSFSLYLMVAYYLIILPLPKTRDVLSLQRPGTKYIQLIPFKFIADFLNETKLQLLRPSTYMHIIKERAFLQPAFNGILLLPLGVYLSYFFHKDLRKTVIISFCVSLFFELTQLSALYGFYNRPYRIFDVDDLMMNTLGGYLGYLISPLFKKALPNVRKLDDKVELEQLPVGFIRRFMAFGIDWFIYLILDIVSRGFFKVYIFVFIYFILIPYFTNGRTFGKWLLRVKVTGMNKELTFKELIIRYGVLYYVFFGMDFLITGNNALSKMLNKSVLGGILVVLVWLMNLIVFLHLTKHFFSKNKELFHDKLSKTKLTITR